MAEPIVIRVELTGADTGKGPAGAPDQFGTRQEQDARAATKDRQRKSIRDAENKKALGDLGRLDPDQLRDAVGANILSVEDMQDELRRRSQDDAAGDSATARRSRGGAAGAAGDARRRAAGKGGGAGGARGRRRTGVLRAGVASGAATAAARLARPFGGTAAAVAASSAATGAAINPPLAAAALVGVAVAGAALSPVLIALSAAAFSATRAFTEMEQLGQVDPRVALAQAMREMRQLLGLVRRSGRIGGEASAFITAGSQLDQAIRDAGAEILRELLPLLTDVAQVATFLTQTVTPLIGPLFEQVQAMSLALNEVTRRLPLIGDVFADINDAVRELRDGARREAEQAQRDEDDALGRLWDQFDPRDFDPTSIPGISGT